MQTNQSSVLSAGRLPVSQTGSMDIPRPDLARKRRRKRMWLAVGALALVGVITVALSRLQPAAPSVEKGSLYTNTVVRGEMLRDVRGTGTLLPVDIRWVPAANAGRIERILVEAGQAVKADTILVELKDPVLEQEASTAKSALDAAEANLANMRVQVEGQRLTQVATLASAQANYVQAQQDFEVNDELARSGLIPAITLKQSKAKAEELRKLFEIEKQRLDLVPSSAKAQLDAQQAQVNQLKTQSELKREQVEMLKVRAGMNGIVQKLGETALLQVGQQVPAGANLARVSDPSRLKAQVKIPDTQARDIAVGQVASIDTRNGVIPGHVIRVDPASENGTVNVDVALDGPLPKGARPELTVDGRIEIERLENALHVGRPVQGQPESTVGIFKLTNGGQEAIRVPVKFGRSSVTSIEVVAGLQEGDQIILSDMSAWDAYPRVRLR